MLLPLLSILFLVPANLFWKLASALQVYRLVNGCVMIEIQGKSFLCERKWIILRAVVIGASGHVGSYMFPNW